MDQQQPGTACYLVSEANGTRSRDVVTLAQGHNCLPGTVLGKITASGKYAAHDPAAVDGTETAVAVLWGNADASAGDAPAVAVVRGPAIVNRHDLFFAGTPSEGEIAAAHTALLAAGILVR